MCLFSEKLFLIIKTIVLKNTLQLNTPKKLLDKLGYVQTFFHNLEHHLLNVLYQEKLNEQLLLFY